MLTLNGLMAADKAIVPLQCEILGHCGSGQFLYTVADVQQITKPGFLRLLGACYLRCRISVPPHS